jgi:hypothetical protein
MLHDFLIKKHIYKVLFCAELVLYNREVVLRGICEHYQLCTSESVLEDPCALCLMVLP